MIKFTSVTSIIAGVTAKQGVTLTKIRSQTHVNVFQELGKEMCCIKLVENAILGVI